ncbi:MAG: spore coat protein [Clostridia bacterium]|nr:spore coat protein [Clostridia bacterium]
MTETISSKELSMISQALTCEGLICKKARMYANTLTNAALAECMSGIASAHEQRYNELLKQLN